MKITITTVFISLVSCLSIWRILANIKRESIGIRSAVVWLFIWVGIGFFALFPDLLDSAMHIAQMENRMFFILLLAVFILFAIVFNLTSQLDMMQRNLAKIVREISLINYRMENSDKKPEEETKDTN
jgi:hypothetical protein